MSVLKRSQTRNTRNASRAVTNCFAKALLFSICSLSAAEAERSEQTLEGKWQFRRETSSEKWSTVHLPCNFEEHEGVGFDGVGIYRKTIPTIRLPQHARAILHFQAAATETEVWFDGELLGKHLGGWTPFRFDVTEQVRANQSEEAHEIRVRVDEKVGHNSQGFLPTVCPHYGGLWQEVRLLVVSEMWIDELEALAVGDPSTGRIRLELPLEGNSRRGEARVIVRHRLLGSEEWSSAREFPMGKELEAPKSRQVLRLEVPVKDWQWWSPRDPNLYELDIRLTDGNAGVSEDRITLRAAFRTIEVDRRRLLLNGKPLAVRGLLNWGYAPPRVAPSIDPAFMRRELEFARSRGFNLMKFCLWAPPKRYLELADEMGMLTWMEYPTWHSDWDKSQLPTLRREFTEFFCYDRNHPSVVLRSLTCETGPRADIDVIRNLYDLCHAMVPGAVVEDDSSWIAWNRVHDFYDDHPYGNNHTWVKTLNRLKQHIIEHGPKPLVLGEAICADTWIDRQAILRRIGNKTELPFWAPLHFDDTLRWEETMRRVDGTEGLEHLSGDARHYGMLMRKYQIETYRREVPEGGYVISVIRDIPKASMGLIDYTDRPKWTEKDWRWQRDTLCILHTENDRRSFTSGESLDAELLVSHFGHAPLHDARLVVSCKPESESSASEVTLRRLIDQKPGTLEKAAYLEWSLPEVPRPERWMLRAELREGQNVFMNEWPIWVVPRAVSKKEWKTWLHESFPSELAGSLALETPDSNQPAKDEIVLTSRLDANLMGHLESGGRVLLLPDGQKGSFPLSDHWFLRGAPYVSDRHPLSKTVPRDLFVELQHFDLAGPVIPRIDYLDQIDPVLLLWATHDMDHVETHALLFEARVGSGRLMVSALRHTGPTNAAGRWMLTALLDHLAQGPKPRHALDADVRHRMRAKLEEAKISLLERSWRFAPAPENDGLKRGWHLPDAADESWKEIHIGRAWESQGYPDLDGWAWYRIDVDVPRQWKERPVYLTFEGVDDYYEVYVNGKQAGSGGDIENQETAFELRKSHPITELVVPGGTAVIAVRVYDWYGAGGLFRPITLSTVPLESGPSLLK